MRSDDIDSEDKVEYPDFLFCPITQELLSDPVVDSTGKSFSRTAYVKQYRQKHHDQDPPAGFIVTNYALAAIINAWAKVSGPAIDKAPACLCDSTTLSLFESPVISVESAQTHSQKSIEMWLTRGGGKDPNNKVPLVSKEMFANEGVEKCVEWWKEKHPELVEKDESLEGEIKLENRYSLFGHSSDPYAGVMISATRHFTDTPKDIRNRLLTAFHSVEDKLIFSRRAEYWLGWAKPKCGLADKFKRGFKNIIEMSAEEGEAVHIEMTELLERIFHYKTSGYLGERIHCSKVLTDQLDMTNEELRQLIAVRFFGSQSTTHRQVASLWGDHREQYNQHQQQEELERQFGRNTRI